MEYPLPATDVPIDVRQNLHPWIAEFIGMDPEQARQKLAARWASVSRSSLAALRNTLLTFEVRSIAIHDGRSYLHALRPDSDEEVIGNDWYLPGPMSQEQVQEEVDSTILKGNASLASFLFYFGGIAESLTYSGNFVYSAADAKRYDDFLRAQNEPLDDFSEWTRSLIVYYDLSGNQVLVHSSGKVGWYILAEHMVVHEAASFDAFITSFSEQRKYPYPFTAYGIPDEVE